MRSDGIQGSGMPSSFTAATHTPLSRWVISGSRIGIVKRQICGHWNGGVALVRKAHSQSMDAADAIVPYAFWALLFVAVIGLAVAILVW